MFYLWIRPRSTCFTTKGSKQSLSPLAITTWRWHAGPLSLGSPTSFTSSANIGLNTLSQCSPSRNMFHQAKGITSWHFHELKVSYKKVFSIHVLALNPFIHTKSYPNIVWRNKRKTSNTFGFSQEPLTDDNAYGHLSDGSKGFWWQGSDHTGSTHMPLFQ